jgi:hypothetical protein
LSILLLTAQLDRPTCVFLYFSLGWIQFVKITHCACTHPVDSCPANRRHRGVPGQENIIMEPSNCFESRASNVSAGSDQDTLSHSPKHSSLSIYLDITHGRKLHLTATILDLWYTKKIEPDMSCWYLACLPVVEKHAGS